MKIKHGFILRQLGNDTVVVPVGAQTVDFRCIITLNDTGAFLWSKLAQETDRDALIAALLDEYDVDEARAAADVDAFIDRLNEVGVLA